MESVGKWFDLKFENQLDKLNYQNLSYCVEYGKWN
jgi:uncharacterized protein YeaC (DUF1315 family)